MPTLGTGSAFPHSYIFVPGLPISVRSPVERDVVAVEYEFAVSVALIGVTVGLFRCR